MKKELNIKFFVTHFNNPNCIYEDNIFVPIQAWKKNSKIDLWIQWDDTWDNISDKNSQYAELTTQYWVRKNYDLKNVDYIWFCHYRRYMTYNYRYNILKFWNNFSKQQNIFGKIWSIATYLLWQQINQPFDNGKIEIFSDAIKTYFMNNKYDIYLAKRLLNFTIKPFHNVWLYNENLWEIAHNIIIKHDKTFEKTIQKIDNLKRCNWCNIWIMNKNLFMEYSEWLFSILFEFEKELNAKNLLELGYKEPITAWTRFLWCFWERLFNLRIAHKKEHWLKVSHDANIIFFDDIKK